ncbi:hypothetical protein EVAR_11394_1 [Eumeta japonica]|uniref:Uncharacterized protein n=1 Tax=Eumeta variegata TaxID=151549 RepID=A0A4C1TLK0_EUMVA|nr:hypothetical protein EVAR_11394_1 [Eumeta japonica]
MIKSERRNDVTPRTPDDAELPSGKRASESSKSRLPPSPVDTCNPREVTSALPASRIERISKREGLMGRCGVIEGEWPPVLSQTR